MNVSSNRYNPPIRWGLVAQQGWHSEFPIQMNPIEKAEFMIQMAKNAENAGFDSFWTFDHLHPIPDPQAPHPVFECWTSLAAIARETKTIRLGQAVTCVCFRNPALLAKMAATIDVLSKGRVELGIGAGWYENEFTAYGYDFSQPKERLGRLREGVQIIKKLWTQEKSSFSGKYYTITEAYSYPKPIQKPHPPIMIAGSGERITLPIVAKYANRSNFQDPPNIFVQKLKILKRYCETYNRDYDEIEKAYQLNFVPGKSQFEAEKKMKNLLLPGETLEQLRPFNIWGSPDQLISHFKKYKAMGVTYFIVYLNNLVNEPDDLQYFKDEIIPGLD